MSKRIINNYEDFAVLLGQEIGVSDYITITQEQINKFAEATIDYQWIHVDPDRAAIESPYQNTIAHGYLTLSLLTHLWFSIVEVHNVKMVVNSRVRSRVSLESIANLRGIAKIQVKILLEIEGVKKPAYDCIATFLYHFNNE